MTADTDLIRRFDRDMDAIYVGAKAIGYKATRIVERLRAPVLPTLESVVGTLVAHLASRIDELWGDLDFIIEGSRIQTRADAFRINPSLGSARRRIASTPSLGSRTWRSVSSSSSVRSGP